MHSLDYRKSSGGFIHGFRYLIKLFLNINYNIPYIKKEFIFTSNLDIYKDLSKYIQHRVSFASSLYQMHSVLCDCYYYDSKTKKIIYYHDVCEKLIPSIINETFNFTTIKLKFGKIDNFDLRYLNDFNLKSPKFLHIEFNLFYYREKNNLENILIQEDLFANFESDMYYNKIYNIVKMSPLIF